MIREAGFEVDGNPLQPGETAGGAARRRIPAARRRPAAAARSRARRRITRWTSRRSPPRRSRRSARAARYRRMRVLEGAQAPRMRVDGRDVLLFAGSNYLDLARHPEVVEASARAAREIGCAAGGSRLISGNLARARGARAGAREVLRGRSRARLQQRLRRQPRRDPGAGRPRRRGGVGRALARVDHRRLPALARRRVRLRRTATSRRSTPCSREAARAHRRVLLAIDGVYSMDGDVAPVAEMVALAKRHGAIVLLDDAHGTGTLGARGRGSAELLRRRATASTCCSARSARASARTARSWPARARCASCS